MAKSKEVKQIGNILKGISAWDNPSVGRVYDQNYCAPTINTCSGGGQATVHHSKRKKRQC